MDETNFSDNVDTSLGYRRLRRNTMSLIHASPSLDYLGMDRFVMALAAGVGIDPGELVILRVMVSIHPVTLVVVPADIWQNPAEHARLLELKAAVEFTGRRAVLVPEAFIQRQPRLDNSRLIETSGTHVTADQRIALLAYLIESGPSALIECAKAIKHDTPIAALLHLAACGVVKIAGGASIGPETIVDLPSQQRRPLLVG